MCAVHERLQTSATHDYKLRMSATASCTQRNIITRMRLSVCILALDAVPLTSHADYVINSEHSTHRLSVSSECVVDGGYSSVIISCVALCNSVPVTPRHRRHTDTGNSSRRLLVIAFQALPRSFSLCQPRLYFALSSTAFSWCAVSHPRRHAPPIDGLAGHTHRVVAELNTVTDCHSNSSTSHHE